MDSSWRTTVPDDGNFDLGDAAEAERYMHQYTTELEEEMGYDYGMDKVVSTLAIKKVLMMLVMSALMEEHVRGMKMTLTI